MTYNKDEIEDYEELRMLCILREAEIRERLKREARDRVRRLDFIDEIDNNG